VIRYAELASGLERDVADFLGQPEAQVRGRMAAARAERNRRWLEADPQSEAERDALYAELGELDLLKYAEWHASDRRTQSLHDRLVRIALRAGGVALDHGGGIGDTALALAANGVAVVYVDFPGPCSEFARFRWRRHGCGERVQPIPPSEFWSGPRERFEAIASIEVLEHLENPVRTALRFLELLRPGGQLFLTAHFRHSGRNPDHLPENDAYHRLFGGERGTPRRCVLTNLGFRRRRWWWFTKPR
jgi:SAM-dependent methyltransferase